MPGYGPAISHCAQPAEVVASTARLSPTIQSSAAQPRERNETHLVVVVKHRTEKENPRIASSARPTPPGILRCSRYILGSGSSIEFVFSCPCRLRATEDSFEVGVGGAGEWAELEHPGRPETRKRRRRRQVRARLRRRLPSSGSKGELRAAATVVHHQVEYKV